jgi:hypothetical protein
VAIRDGRPSSADVAALIPGNLIELQLGDLVQGWRPAARGHGPEMRISRAAEFPSGHEAGNLKGVAPDLGGRALILLGDAARAGFFYAQEMLAKHCGPMGYLKYFALGSSTSFRDPPDGDYCPRCRRQTSGG